MLLYEQGLINQEQATILFPTVIIMGTLVGHFARIVLVSDVAKISQVTIDDSSYRCSYSDAFNESDIKILLI